MFLNSFAVFLGVKCSFQHQQQQFFRVRPRDTSALEGEFVEFNCEISNLAGQVQWSKDGFLLGLYQIITYFNDFNSLSVDQRF